MGVDALVALVARTSPLDVSPDALVLCFTAGISAASGMLFGLAPAIRASRNDLSAALKERATRLAGRRRFGMAPALVVSQVALSLVLLVGAGLFGRSLLKLQSEDLGFNRDNVLLVDIDPRLAGYKQTELSALYRQLLDRLGALPEVRTASLASYSPLSGTSSTRNVSLQGHTPEPGESMQVSDILVGPNYCEVLEVPLLLGREIGFQDTPASPKVAVVNEAFTKRFFPGENPVGRRFGFGTSDDPKHSSEIEIVGVIGDVKYYGIKEKPEPTVYGPILQVQNQSAFSSNLEIRTEADPSAAASDVRAAISQVDDQLPIVNVTSFNKQLDNSIRQESLIAQLVSFFGLLALLLACVGLYGIMAHAVVRRTNEIGIRMALGAQRSDILWMVLRETLALVLLGIAIGIPVAMAGARLISSQLFGLNAANPLTLLIAATLLTGVAALAGYLPARRASLVDPMVALRCE